MLGLWVDVFLHSSINPTKIYVHSIQANHWSLNFGMNLEKLRISIPNQNFKKLFNFFRLQGSHGDVNAVLLVWFQKQIIGIQRNLISLIGPDRLIIDERCRRSNFGILRTIFSLIN